MIIDIIYSIYIKFRPREYRLLFYLRSHEKDLHWPFRKCKIAFEKLLRVICISESSPDLSDIFYSLQLTHRSKRFFYFLFRQIGIYPSKLFAEFSWCSLFCSLQVCFHSTNCVFLCKNGISCTNHFCLNDFYICLYSDTIEFIQYIYV